MRKAALIPSLLALAVLGGCASARLPSGPAAGTSTQAPVYGQYGVVTRIEALASDRSAQDRTNAMVLGGIAGALIGRQFADSSRGKNVGTVAGAAAGAMIGHQYDKEQSGGAGAVRITVGLDRGGSRSFDYGDAGVLRVGDRVRVDGDRLVRL